MLCLFSSKDYSSWYEFLLEFKHINLIYKHILLTLILVDLYQNIIFDF